MTVRSDYDDDPGRYRLGMHQARTLLTPGTLPVLERVWQVIPPAGDGEIVADIGSADGALAAARPAGRPGRLLALDRSLTMLRAHPGPAVQADATALPLREQSVTAVVLANMLYHLPDPATALRAARRALVPDGQLPAPLAVTKRGVMLTGKG